MAFTRYSLTSTLSCASPSFFYYLAHLQCPHALEQTRRVAVSQTANGNVAEPGVEPTTSWLGLTRTHTHIYIILLHDYCAIYDPLPTPLLHAIDHTILVMAISCNGQRPHRSVYPSTQQPAWPTAHSTEPALRPHRAAPRE